MYKTLFLSLVFFITISISYAQLSGTKTIGGSGANYSTISAAVAALNSSGVSGPVTFNIAPGTYTENFTINNIAGAGTANTIIFQSANNDSSSVLVQYASSASSTNNFLVKLNSAKFIKFKSLTLERTGSDANAVVVKLAGVCNNISFEHCVIKNSITTSSSFSSALIYGPNTSNNLSYITLNNNYLQNGSMGIYLQGGGSTNLHAGAIITNNVFSNQYRWVIALYYQDAPIINGNTITSTSTYYDYRAIYNQYSKNGLQIKKNIISAVKGYGLRMENCIGTTLAGLISNNFISFTGSGAYAMHYSNSGSHNIYYNSINLAGSSSTGLFVNGQTSSNIRFQNNIVKIAGTGNCMNIDQSTNFPFLISDNNDFYFPQGHLGKWKSTSNISTLAAWRTASNWEFNSVNYNPNYISNSDLHINGYSNISKKGTSAITTPSTTYDIDGTIRNSTTPDIGADEFSYEDFAISSIITNSPYCSGENETISAYIVNNGNVPYNSNMNLSYKLGTNSAVVQSTAINLNAGDSQLVSFTTPLHFATAGTFNLIVKHLYAGDQDASNNEKAKSILVKQSPSINWPLDTLVCANHSIILDAGAGMDSYLWSTGASSQSITVDSSGIGLGAKYFKVDISLNGCSTSDSILVNFVYCAGIDIAVNKNINIYPNPSNGMVFIDASFILKNSQLKVYNTSGKLVKAITIKSNSFDVSDLNSGLYFIIISTEKGLIEKALIKN